MAVAATVVAAAESTTPYSAGDSAGVCAETVRDRAIRLARAELPILVVGAEKDFIVDAQVSA